MAKQKVVIELSIDDNKRRSKALQVAVGLHGVTSVEVVDGGKLVVVGNGVDAIKMTVLLRKSLGCAKIVSLEPVEEKKEEKPAAPAPATPAEPCAVYSPCWTPCHGHPAYYIFDGWW